LPGIAMGQGRWCANPDLAVRVAKAAVQRVPVFLEKWALSGFCGSHLPDNRLDGHLFAGSIAPKPINI